MIIYSVVDGGNIFRRNVIIKLCVDQKKANTKAKNFFDVCCLFFDLFCLFLDLIRFRLV